MDIENSESVEREKRFIDNMSREELKHMHDIGPAVGHKFFIEGTPLCEHFRKRYNLIFKTNHDTDSSSKT